MTRTKAPRNSSALRAGRDRLKEVVRDETVRQVGHTLGARIGLIAIGLVTSILVARALGPEGRGLYIVATTIGAIGVQLGNLGLPAANTYYVARDRSLVPSLVGNSVAASVVVGGLGASGLAALFLLRPGIAPVQGALLFLALASIPFGLLSLLLQQLLIGVGRIRDANRVDLGSRLLGMALLVLLLLGGLVSVGSVYFAAFLVGPVTIAWIAIALRKSMRGTPRFVWPMLRSSLGYGGKAWLIALFSFLVIRSDLLMVQYLRGAEETGQYSIAVTLADFAYLLSLVVGTVLFPKLSGMADVEARWQLARRWAAMVGIVMTVGVGLAPIVARPVIRIAYGVEFEPATPALLFLLPGILFLGVETVIAQFLAASGMPRSLAIAWGAALLLNLGLNLALLPRYGFVGAAVSSAICYGFMLLGVLGIARRVRPLEDANRFVPLSWRFMFRLLPVRVRVRVASWAQVWMMRGLLLRRLRGLGTVHVPSIYGPSLELRFEDDVDFQGVYVLGSYETGTTEICRCVLRTGDVALDVGANLGWYTCLFSRLVGDDGQVHAFEPEPGTLERLQRNVQHNDRSGNVRLNGMAVGQGQGTAVIHRFRRVPHGHATTVPAPGAVVEDSTDVPLTTLDAYVTSAGDRPVALVKVDVEGSEPAVVAGAAGLIHRAVPPMWIIEINLESLGRAGSGPAQLLAPLVRRGYALLRIEGAWGRWRSADVPEELGHGDNVFCYLPQVHGDRIARL